MSEGVNDAKRFSFMPELTRSTPDVTAFTYWPLMSGKMDDAPPPPPKPLKPRIFHLVVMEVEELSLSRAYTAGAL